MKWHYTKGGDYPQKTDDKGYGDHVPCLVEMENYDYKLLCYNTYYQCWDDDECDDFYCDIHSVKRWISVQEINDAMESES